MTAGTRLALGHPAEHGADAREELLDVERLGHVVVGAGVERGDLVGLAVARGQHHDRNVAERAHPAQHLDAVDVGEPEVEQHDVGPAVGDQHDRILAARRTR